MKKNWIIFSVSIIAMSTTAFVFSNISEKVEYVNSGKAGCKPPEQEKQNPREDNRVDWKYWNFNQDEFDEYVKNVKVLENDGIPFSFKIGSRFNATISKSDLHSAKSILDIIPTDARNNYQQCWITSIGFSDDYGNVPHFYSGESTDLSQEQIDFVKSAKYDSKIRITASCEALTAHTDQKMNMSKLVHYISVVPEKEAEYQNGDKALIEYLKKGSKKEILKIEDRSLIGPGKMEFTIGTNGLVKNYKLIHSCGFKAVDMQMLSLINNIPGKWTPAKDANGNAVEQTFVYSFGIEGC